MGKNGEFLVIVYDLFHNSIKYVRNVDYNNDSGMMNTSSTEQNNKNFFGGC